ncbi:hexose kinase [Carnobacterium gallinarum]|uniref:hexose kinase n=1 Tax=Carnobacterium gallinarum TaxID=2749 RepID=UPI00054F568F|nr:hexose kinase [Carnobacterium gallinarum]
MILTITMNPSVDISYPLEKFVLNDVNRVTDTRKTAGGKGLNVARVIKLLDYPVGLSGILGGTIGEFIENELEKIDIPSHFLKISQESRNCIAILHDGQQTEILESGPTLSEQEATDFLTKFTHLLKEETVEMITVSGSLPTGLNSALYQQLVAIAQGEDVPILLDCSGEPLEKILLNSEKPTLIKPNQSELSQLMGRTLSDDPKELQAVLSESLFAGIPWIVVSLGAAGAFVKYEETFYQVEIPKITAVNPVGSGDATVAGLAVALAKQEDPISVIKTAMTTGILNTLEVETGSIDGTQFNDYFAQVKVIKMT